MTMLVSWLLLSVTLFVFAFSAIWMIFNFGVGLLGLIISGSLLFLFNKLDSLKRKDTHHETP